MKPKLFFFIGILLLSSIFGSIIPIQKVFANGGGGGVPPVSNGFTVRTGDVLTYIVTKNSTFFLNAFNIGDLLQYNITSVNDSVENTGAYLLPIPYYATMVYAYLNYYNSTNSTWSYNLNNETLISTYNATSPFTNVTLVGYWEEGEYYTFNIGSVGWLFGVPLAPVPLNYTAFNNTIINMTHAFFSYSPFPYFYSSPTNTVEGNWTMGTGDGVTNGSVKLCFIINDKGILTKQQIFYNNNTMGWELDYEIVLLPSIENLLNLYLLFYLFPKPIDCTLILVIGFIIGITTFILIGLYKKHKHIRLVIIQN